MVDTTALKPDAIDAVGDVGIEDRLRALAQRGGARRLSPEVGGAAEGAGS